MKSTSLAFRKGPFKRKTKIGLARIHAGWKVHRRKAASREVPVSAVENCTCGWSSDGSSNSQTSYLPLQVSVFSSANSGARKRI